MTERISEWSISEARLENVTLRIREQKRIFSFSHTQDSGADTIIFIQSPFIFDHHFCVSLQLLVSIWLNINNFVYLKTQKMEFKKIISGRNKVQILDQGFRMQRNQGPRGPHNLTYFNCTEPNCKAKLTTEGLLDGEL